MAKAKKGDRYQCDECGVVMVVDEACGCDECDVICCGAPMKKVEKSAAKSATKK